MSTRIKIFPFSCACACWDSFWHNYLMQAFVLALVLASLVKTRLKGLTSCFLWISGTANRTVAATQMNATSSRAHTVVTIIFDQISKNDSGQETKKSSNINLVDLAGWCSFFVAWILQAYTVVCFSFKGSEV